MVEHTFQGIAEASARLVYETLTRMMQEADDGLRSTLTPDEQEVALPLALAAQLGAIRRLAELFLIGTPADLQKIVDESARRIEAILMHNHPEEMKEIRRSGPS